MWTDVLLNILVLFLVVNAVFWGLASHSEHCNFLHMLLPKMKCPAHWIHLTLGVVCFLLAVAVINRKYIFRLK